MPRLAQLVCLLLAISGTTALPARADPVKDMLGVPGPIGFQDIEFDLAWSANPVAGYFKQEYLPAGQQLASFEQMFVMRPLPGWARYRTPVAGLYLCGSGAHPGGGVTGAPGHNAAREILADFRSDRLRRTT